MKKLILWVLSSIISVTIWGQSTPNSTPKQLEEKASIEKVHSNVEDLKKLLKIREHEINKLKSEITRLKDMSEALDNPLSRAAAGEWILLKDLQGAFLFSQDSEQTFLGVIDFLGKKPESIFNEQGLYGSPLGVNSIWNDAGQFGFEDGDFSARNDEGTHPPMIVKENQIIGYLTTNQSYQGTPHFDPYYFQELAFRIQGK